jgi:enterobacterial common antigen flippase
VSDKNSYKQILRSSSIMGGSQALTYIIGLIRIKVVAVLLGPSGVGLVSLYGSALGLLGTVTGLGIGSSGVREVVQVYSQNDSQQAARTVRILRRACWVTGLLGWLLAAALAQPISAWVLGSTEHAWAIAVLGVTLLIGAISSGQLALLQGLRRIGDLARANVFGVLVSTCVSIGLYAWLGQAGIVPVLVASALVSLGFSYWFARRVEVQATDLSWAETFAGTKRLVGLGVAFMWSGLLTAGVDLLTRTVITKQLGLESAGIYQAAWALSGLFAGFILSAMGADFYPRLTAAIHDKAAAVRMVNEQTEVGILLAFPGLLGTLAFAPWAMEIFYTKSFVAGAELLPWFVLGVFGRVLSWPMGFIQLAAGASKWFFATETIFLGIQATLIIWLVPAFGIAGAAYAFAATYALYTAGMYWVGNKLIEFNWSLRVVRLLVFIAMTLIIQVSLNVIVDDWLSNLFSIMSILSSGIFVTIILFKKSKKDDSIMLNPNVG